MRKVIWGAAVSLDLYLAGPGRGAGLAALERRRGGDQRRELEGRRHLADGPQDLRVRGEERRRRRAGASKIRTYIFSAHHGRGAGGRGAGPRGRRRLRARAEGRQGGDIIVMGGGELGTRPDRGRGGRRDRAQRPPDPARRRHSLLPADGAARSRPTLVEARPIAKDCVFLRYRLAGDLANRAAADSLGAGHKGGDHGGRQDRSCAGAAGLLFGRGVRDRDHPAGHRDPVRRTSSDGATHADYREALAQLIPNFVGFVISFGGDRRLLVGAPPRLHPRRPLRRPAS